MKSLMMMTDINWDFLNDRRFRAFYSLVGIQVWLALVISGFAHDHAATQHWSTGLIAWTASVFAIMFREIRNRTRE